MKSTSKVVRMKNEAYYTPKSLVKDLLAVETFERVYDPCAGAGHIIDACREFGIPADGTDIVEAPGILAADFLSEKVWRPGDGFDCDVILNPPYGQGGRLAVAFIEKLLLLTREKRRKVAVLLHEDFDAGITRKHLFRDHRAFVRKYVLLNRIYWANLEVKERSSTNHAFFVFDSKDVPILASTKPRKPPTLHYLASSDGQDWGKVR